MKIGLSLSLNNFPSKRSFLTPTNQTDMKVCPATNHHPPPPLTLLSSFSCCRHHFLKMMGYYRTHTWTKGRMMKKRRSLSIQVMSQMLLEAKPIVDEKRKLNIIHHAYLSKLIYQNKLRELCVCENPAKSRFFFAARRVKDSNFNSHIFKYHFLWSR